MLRQARAFFADRAIIEVDCPQITAYASVDAHIDLIETIHPYGNRFLHSSPEYGMKRLLSEGIGDIYQLSHVFRQEECGVKHNPEFMMAEWYRTAITFDEMIAETAEFCQLFLGNVPIERLTYREAFLKYAKIDPFKTDCEGLLSYLMQQKTPIYTEAAVEGKDALLNLILGLHIEPHLGTTGITVLSHYPSSQAALAKTTKDGDDSVALRFEVYHKGIELANGYCELLDRDEQEWRLLESNNERLKMGKNALPIDNHFLAALANGMPECCGVAVGFDRLLMLHLKAQSIADVIPFAWSIA